VSNHDWTSRTDPDARIAKLKDGRTRLAYKPEHVVDLETGAIVAAAVHGADAADPASVEASLAEAEANLQTARGNAPEAPQPADAPPRPRRTARRRTGPGRAGRSWRTRATIRPPCSEA